jgi:hypothetical protein
MDEANRPRVRQLFVALPIAFSAPASGALNSWTATLDDRPQTGRKTISDQSGRQWRKLIMEKADHERRRVRAVGVGLPYRRETFTITGCPDFASGL